MCGYLCLYYLIAVQSSLIASLSAKLAPQLSPRTSRRAISSITQADPTPKSKGNHDFIPAMGTLDLYDHGFESWLSTNEAP